MIVCEQNNFRICVLAADTLAKTVGKHHIQERPTHDLNIIGNVKYNVKQISNSHRNM